MEAKIAHASGWQYAAVSAGKFRRLHKARWWQHFQDPYTLWLNIRDIFRLMKGLIQALGILRHFQPDVVFIKGGYVGLPVGLAAAILRVPYLVHESDLSPGLTNRILARWARSVAVGFPAEKYRGWYSEKLVYTGNPIRSDVAGAHRLEGLAHFKLSDKLPVIAVTGGSLGAASINDAVIEALPELLPNYQVIHISGERDIERVKFEFRRLNTQYPERYKVFAFLGEGMGRVLAAADLVISRAGANTLAELALLAKPAIVIPNNAMAGHQIDNAVSLSRSGAIRVIQEEKLTPAILIREIKTILSSEGEQKRLADAISKLAVPDASHRLAELILKTAHGD